MPLDLLQPKALADIAVAVTPARPVLPERPPRDDRLDFFRGVLQLEIFIAHLPGSVLALLLHRNWGFTDSSELFVFFSGYVLASVFSLKLAKQGFRGAATDMIGRAWRLYTRHLLMLVAFAALVVTGAAWSQRPDYIDGVRLDLLLADPGTALTQAVLLRYQPILLDILPLFIVMIAALPLLVTALARLGPIVLAGPALLWLGTQIFGWAPGTWPAEPGWVFNPLAWFFLFSLGAYFGRAALLGQSALPSGRWFKTLVWGYFAFATGLSLIWYASELFAGVPAVLSDQLFPFDKANLSPWLLAHGLSLAYVVSRICPRDAAFWRSRLARPLVFIGRHSLDVFCVGTFASMIGYMATDALGGGWVVDVIVGALGCAVLVLFATMREGARAR